MEKHLINRNASLLDALRQLNELSGSTMTLFAVDEDGRVSGSVTDGDIRRALIAGATPLSPVAEAERRDFSCVRGEAPDVEELRRLRMKGIGLVPRLDDEGRIAGIIDLNVTPTILPLRAMLMAGGKGERLRPLTLTVPKPLLEIDGKAIIDYNIEALAAAGIDDITVSTAYLAEALDAHFARPVAGVRVKTVRESTPLGTIGSASLVDWPAEGNTIVMNSDLLTTISFEEMYLHHRAERADITIATIPYAVSVPYAILSTDGPRVTGIEEKPSYSYYANAGIYIISNPLLRSIPQGRRIDATDFIEQAIADGRRVAYYPIRGTWIDVGSPTDFRQASELMRLSRVWRDKNN
ncbi:MAG: NTP transferase domain-containing protein [Muribaculaceae bacterium]|nr:NTP transferase domain-containing protein [Muribaculaceae bacterium]